MNGLRINNPFSSASACITLPTKPDGVIAFRVKMYLILQARSSSSVRRMNQRANVGVCVCVPKHARWFPIHDHSLVHYFSINSFGVTLVVACYVCLEASVEAGVTVILLTMSDHTLHKKNSMLRLWSLESTVGERLSLFAVAGVTFRKE